MRQPVAAEAGEAKAEAVAEVGVGVEARAVADMAQVAGQDPVAGEGGRGGAVVGM